MGLPTRVNNAHHAIRSPYTSRSPSYLLPSVCVLAFLSLTVVFVFKVQDFAYQTKTVAGHNLVPTPWHLFEPKIFDEQTSYARASKILQCQYFTCRSSIEPQIPLLDPSKSSMCPEFFRWIHRDLEPWSQTKISPSHLMELKDFAAFRVIIVGGRLYVDLYYSCVQSRMIFTVWGLLQLLKRYPGMVPDVDMMFDCMDKPAINRTGHSARPLPLFRYCTTTEHFDIPFPDWSFWGWPEANLGPWDEEFREIRRGVSIKKLDKQVALCILERKSVCCISASYRAPAV
ncbi:hypothetical protein Ancab_011427 [Ancistrocladus abbreviatus]